MKRERKALWLILLIAILPITTLTMIDVAKACPISVYVDPPQILDTSLLPGEQFTVNLMVDFVSEPSAYQFELGFNPDVLHGVSVENGPFLGSNGGDIIVFPGEGFDNEKGTLGLFGAIIDPPDLKNPTGEDGILATATFEVVGIGGSPIKFGEEKDITMLLNKTGGTEFDGEIAEAWIRLPGETPTPNPGFLNHGYFDNRPQISVEPHLTTAVPVGENFTVDVNIVNVTDLYSWEFNMNWTAPLLNVTSVIEGEFLKSEPPNITQFHQEAYNDEGYIYMNSSRTGGSGVDGSGTLTSITFLVEGEGNSTLHLYNINLLNSTGGTIDIGTSDGQFNNVKFRNIAVEKVMPYPTVVTGGSGDPIYVNVTVVNKGSFNETGIDVALYSDEDEIYRETDISLDKGASRTFTFTWNTTDVSVGKYTISANATILEDESDTTDNTHVYGLVIISGNNIAVTRVDVPVSSAFLGHNVTVRVDVENQGTETVAFNITAYYHGVDTDSQGEIGMEHIERLSYGESSELEFQWDTTGLGAGYFNINANATILEDESNTTDNSRYAGGTVQLVEVEPPPLIDPFYILVIVAVVILGSLYFLYWWRKRSPEA